jgi:Methyltransferase domain
MVPLPVLRWVYQLKLRSGLQSVCADVDYALEMSRAFLNIAQQAKVNLAQANILEIGPGKSFAPQLVLASHGARITAADPFLVGWDNSYHPTFYREFRARWHGPSTAIDEVIEANAYPPEVIRRVTEPAERLSTLSDQRFDLIFSNAVLEHVSDLISASRVLAELTRIGGMNSHQVDFRDHLSPAQPLNFLTRSNLQFFFERTRHPSQGNRLRYGECVQIFRQAGFSLESGVPNCFVEDEYLADFLPKLRASKSRYREWPPDDLRILGAHFLLRRV